MDNGPRISSALDIAMLYAGFDGDPHKVWVIDQMVRTLTGNGYADWVKAYNAGDDGPNTYEWEEGIAP